jgi:hypothetical protein
MTEPNQPPPVHWPYVDVMATALALVDAQTLSASDRVWNEAWQKIVEDPELAPLLPDVWFEERSPYPPLSDQVETLRRVLLRSGVLSLGNPRYAKFSIDDSAKASIRGENSALLAAEGERLAKMAEVLQTALLAG